LALQPCATPTLLCKALTLRARQPSQLLHGLVPVIPIRAVGAPRLFPEKIRGEGNLFVRQRRLVPRGRSVPGRRRSVSPTVLSPKHLVKPAVVLFTQRNRRLTPVVDLRGESSLVVAAGQRRLQVEHRLAVAARQRH